MEKTLPGFGELFRRLSAEEIGTKAIATRADAGIADGVPVFCLPGSENAARLGAEQIIVPEAGHLSGLAARDDDEDDEE
jgi:molybdenum cofactor biosynthesis protein B